MSARATVGAPTRPDGDRPLSGRRILVTRPREQASELSELLQGLGAEVLQIPAIRIEPPSDPDALRRAVADAGAYDWIVLTSVNGVERFASTLDELGRRRGSSVSLPRLGAIGPATASAIQQQFGRVDLVAEVHTAEGLVHALESARVIAGSRFLLPLAAGARDILAQSIRDRGGEVVQVEAYRTVVDSASVGRMREALDGGRVDMVTFTSASSVRSYLELAGGVYGAAVATIGPITSEAARTEGLSVDVEGDPHTVTGLVEAIVRFYVAGPTQRPQ